MSKTLTGGVKSVRGIKKNIKDGVIVARDFRPLADAIKYFEEIGPELYELEKKVKEIKQSEEYMKALNVISTYANRDIIDQAPKFKNGYELPNTIDIKGECLSRESFMKKFS